MNTGNQLARLGGGVSQGVSPEHPVNERRLMCASLTFRHFYPLTLNTYRAQAMQEVGAEVSQHGCS